MPPASLAGLHRHHPHGCRPPRGQGTDMQRSELARGGDQTLGSGRTSPASRTFSTRLGKDRPPGDERSEKDSRISRRENVLTDVHITKRDRHVAAQSDQRTRTIAEPVGERACAMSSEGARRATTVLQQATREARKAIEAVHRRGQVFYAAAYPGGRGHVHGKARRRQAERARRPPTRAVVVQGGGDAFPLPVERLVEEIDRPPRQGAAAPALSLQNYPAKISPVTGGPAGVPTAGRHGSTRPAVGTPAGARGGDGSGQGSIGSVRAEDACCGVTRGHAGKRSCHVGALPRSTWSDCTPWRARQVHGRARRLAQLLETAAAGDMAAVDCVEAALLAASAVQGAGVEEGAVTA
eukprot:4776283-Pleurochrysis_carterae.AAC.2